MLRNHGGWSRSAQAFRVLHQLPKRWPVKMIEVGMGDQHQVNGREIVDLHAWLPQSLQHKQPASKVRINQDVLSADLHEEAGMPDKGHAHLPV